MLKTNLTTKSGKIIANILQKSLKHDFLTGVNQIPARDYGVFETSLSPSTSTSLASPVNLAIICLWYDQNKLNFPEPEPEFEPVEKFNHAVNNNDEDIAEKRFLNATTKMLKPQIQLRKFICQIPITKQFLRGMCSVPTTRALKLPIGHSGEPTFKMTKRWFSPKINSRSNCAEWCGEDVCNLNSKKAKMKKSMWLTPDCYGGCELVKPYRYDVEYMPGSDKETREYQQTWVECPPLRIVPKKICCYDQECYPPICKRPRKPRGEYTCNKEKSCNKKETSCVKARMPCCEQVREPPTCKIYPTPSCCQKRCTPYPSFSECCHPDANKSLPIECLCLIKPTMCEVWANWRKKHAIPR